MMKKNNKGLSLVELIVVIALMAVLIGIGTFSFSLLFGTQAKACAQNVSGMLNETKTGCMSRYDEMMTLSYREPVEESDPAYDPAIKSNGYYAENQIYTIDEDAQPVAVTKTVDGVKEAITEIRKMGSSRVVIKVYFSDTSVVELGQTRSITVSFNRSSGALDKVIVDGTQTDLYIDKITFQSGLRTYTIEMVQETGKHTLQG